MCWENPGFVEVMGKVHETFHLYPHLRFPKGGPTPVYNSPGIKFRRDSSALHFVGCSILAL